MKEFKNFFLISFLSLSIISCGSNGEKEDAQEKVKVKVTGKAIDGYLANADVCLDLNNNDKCDTNEPSTKTDKEGNFTLSYSKTEKPVNVIVYNGQDKDRLFKDFEGKLKALNNKKNIIVTPLSTLQSYYMAQGKTEKEANEKINKFFNLNGNDINTDYIDSKNKKLLSTNLNLQYTIDLLIHLGQDKETLFKKFAQKFDNSETIEEIMEKLFKKTSDKKENLAKIATKFSKNLNKISENSSSFDEIKKRMLTYKHKIAMASFNNIGVYYDYDKHLKRLKEIGISKEHIEYKIPVEVIEGNSEQVLKAIDDSKNLEYNEKDYKKIFLSDLGLDINEKTLNDFNIDINDSINDIKEKNSIFQNRIEKIEKNIKNGNAKDSGRLVLSDNSKDKNKIYVFDLEKEKIITEKPIEINNTQINKIIPSPQYRFALLLEDKNSNTDIIDGGLFEEDNCDSTIKADYTPSLFTKSTLSLELNDTKTSNGFISLYTDKIKEPDGTQYSYASIAEDSDLYSNTQGFLNLNKVIENGLVEPLGKNFIMAVNKKEASKDKFISLFKYDKMEQVYKAVEDKEFKSNIQCKEILTSISITDKTLFTCDKDLILVKRIHNHEHHDHDGDDHHEHGHDHGHAHHDHEHGHDHGHAHHEDIHAKDSFKEEKIVNPANIEFVKLFGTKYSSIVIAQSIDNKIYSIDLNNDSNKIEEIKITNKLVHLELDDKGKVLIIVDNKGLIHFLDVENNFKNKKTITVFENEPTEVEMTKNIANDNIYILNKNKKEIISINSKTYKINDKFLLNFTPNKLTWLGMGGKGYIFKQNRKHCNAAIHDHDHGEHGHAH